VNGEKTAAVASNTANRNALESEIRDCYRTWSKSYYQDYYSAQGAYPPVHTAIVRDLLAANRARSLLDAGCGPASMLRDLAIPGLERWGFDLTPEMVAEAQDILAAQGLPKTRIWQGSALDPNAFLAAPDRPPAGYDAAICFGVMPHVPESADTDVLANLVACVRPGGLVAVEARNALFASFTQNRFTSELFRRVLIREPALRKLDPSAEGQIEAALRTLDGHFRMDLPPVRAGYDNAASYDEVLSRTHVPFELQDAARRAGMSDPRVLFYHFHALPPMFESDMPAFFRTASLAIEDPADWRGYFMASAFVLVGTRSV
jgi:SAM-dependent methyltransferase